MPDTSKAKAAIRSSVEAYLASLSGEQVTCPDCGPSITGRTGKFQLCNVTGCESHWDTCRRCKGTGSIPKEENE